jgi:hypothetical protein
MSETTLHDSIAGGTTSKEQLYLIHVLEMMNKTTACFDEQKTPIKRFKLYIKYLENAVLDDRMRKHIKDTIKVEQVELKKEYGDDVETIEYMIGFITIREVMQYLNDTYEFEHSDIMGMVGLPKDIVPEKQLAEEYGIYEGEGELDEAS